MPVYSQSPGSPFFSFQPDYNGQVHQDFEQYKQHLGTEQFTNPSDTWNNFLQMYIPNAFQAAMLNYQNEYNSPVNQMLRYQEAGINPYSALSNISTQSASGNQGAGPGTRHTPGFLEKLGGIVKNISSLGSAFKVATELYDYFNYGRDISRSSLLRSQADAAGAQAEADWKMYWNYGPGMGPNSLYVEGSPRAKYMQESTSRLQVQIKQLQTLVGTIYPSQAAANEARAALQNYAKEIQEGRNQAVLNINTGNKTADSILQFLVYLLQDNSKSLIGLL